MVSTHNPRAKPFLLPDEIPRATLHVRSYLDSNFNVLSGGASLIGASVTFSGRQYDTESGLYYYRWRYYHAQLGLFVSRDPIGYADPLHLYLYALATPIIALDPMGRKSINLPGPNTPPDVGVIGNPTGSGYLNGGGGVWYYETHPWQMSPGLYNVYILSMSTAALSASGALVAYAWGAYGASQFAFAIVEGAGPSGTHMTFGYGTAGTYTWAHRLGGSAPWITTVWATGGSYWTTLSGIPIFSAGAVGTWVGTNPAGRNCVTAAISAFGKGWGL